MHSSPHYQGHELLFGFKQKLERSINLNYKRTTIFRQPFLCDHLQYFWVTLFEGFLKSDNFEKLSTLYYKFAYPE